LYKFGSSDDKCIDSQHFGTCDSHTDFKVKSQSHGAGAYCGGHLAAQLVIHSSRLVRLTTLDLYAAKPDSRPESRFLPTPPAFDAPVRRVPV